jgi:hypothetical protein
MIRFKEKQYSTTILEDAQQGFRELTDKAILEPLDRTIDYVGDVEVNKKKPLKRKFKRVSGVLKPIRRLIKHEEERYNKKK